jgi:hypothetical protein
LLSAGTASVSFANGGEALQIKMNAGVTATLVPGPTDSDALARLGIPAGTLTGAAPASSKSTTPSTTSTTSSSSTPQVFGLGLTGDLDISTSAGAGAVRATLLNVLSAVRSAYTTTNTPPSSASTTTQSSGTAPAYLSAQIANYTLALGMLTGTSSSSTSV